MSKRILLTGEPKYGGVVVPSGKGLEETGMTLWGTQRAYYLFMARMVDKLGFVQKPFLAHYGLAKNVEPLPEDTEVIFAIFPFYKYNLLEFLDYLGRNKKAKLIWIPDSDRRMWGKPVPGARAFLKRCDLILDFEWDTWPNTPSFTKVWPAYKHKRVFFPFYFCPEEWFLNIEFNTQPIMKCLFTGRVGVRYGLRNFLIKRILKNPELKRLVAPLRHPSMEHVSRSASLVTDEQDYSNEIMANYNALSFIDGGLVRREQYVRTLNQYFCSIASGAWQEILVMKYFEIPASGSLMLAQRIPDLDKAGLVPNQHYVPINVEYDKTRPCSGRVISSNIGLVIKGVLSHPERYEAIRREGMEFVRKHHGLTARFNQFKILLGDLLK